MASSQKSASTASWRSLVQSIATFRGDLSSLTAPPFILSPTSQLEYGYYWYAGEAFTAPLTISDVDERFLSVIKYLFTSFTCQFTRRNKRDGYEKKPLNPFLGELFVAELDGGKGSIVSEQVSHHPPVSAFYVSNKEGSITSEGFVGIKARFNGTVQVKQSGHTLYTLNLPSGPEQYLIELPAMHIEGFLTGAPYVELEGKSIVRSSTGLKAEMTYSGAGWVSGNKHSVKAVISKDDTVLYTIKGQWNKKMTVRNEATGVEKPFADLTGVEPVDLDVRPIEEQHELESRRAWKDVADAIRAGDNDAIGKTKSALENHQRDLRAKEKEQGSEWPRRWFELRQPVGGKEFVNQAEDDDVEPDLAVAKPATDDPYFKLGSQPLEPYWRYVPEKYENDTTPPRR